jgi:hypothetical protein
MLAVIREIARHPEMKMQPCVLRRRLGKEMLAMTSHTGEGPALQLARERVRTNLAEDPLVAHIHTRDLLTKRMPGEVTGVGLDFG